MRYRHTVRRAQTAKVVPFHGAGEALANAGAAGVDELTFDEMVGGDLRTHVNHVFRADAEFGELALGLHMGNRKAAPVGLGCALHLGLARSQLQRGIAVLFLRLLGDDLTLLEFEHRARHVLAVVGVNPGHPQLLCNYA